MKWEYKILDIVIAKFLNVKLDVEAATKQLNELGGDGWELIALADTNAHGGSSLTAVMILKRPLREK